MDLPQHPQQEIHPPAEVAKRLGISSAGLRRLAAIYERVYDELPRDPRMGRLWTQEAIDRLERAREVLAAGRAVSVEAALEALAEGADPEALAVREPKPDPLEALVTELRALRVAVEGQNRRIDELVAENRELRAALPAPKVEEELEPPKQGWFAWLRRNPKGR